MTTPARERLYEAQHLVQMEGKRAAVYNPHGKPLDELHELPVIYGWNNGGSPGWYRGVLISADGEGLGGHVCSSEAYMPHDLGILEGTRPDLHETFRKHYPDGYRMEFVPYDSARDHEGIKKAFQEHYRKYPDGQR